MCNLPKNAGDSSSEFAEDNKSLDKRLDIAADRVVKYMITSRITLSTAESCTGGLIAEKVTGVSGASEIFRGGVVSYSEEVKRKVLGVGQETLDEFSVYSAQVASQMSEGVMRLMDSDAAVGVTGIAGPNGGSDDKPVGTVFVSVRYKSMEEVRDLRLYEEYENMDREFIRHHAALSALEMLERLLLSESEGD